MKVDSFMAFASLIKTDNFGQLHLGFYTTLQFRAALLNIRCRVFSGRKRPRLLSCAILIRYCFSDYCRFHRASTKCHL